MPDTFGPGYSEPFGFYDPATSSVRTCEATLPWGSTPSSLTLPLSGCLVDGWLYKLPMSGHRTAENDCSSLLPTPTANQPGGTAEQHLARKAREKGGARKTVTDLRMVVELLPTPTATDSKGSRRSTLVRDEPLNGDTLTDAAWKLTGVHLLPTPTARDYKGQNQRGDAGCLPGAMMHLLPTPTAAVGAAGPDFARQSRPGSGGDDLQTFMVRLTGSDSPPPSDDGSTSSGDPSLPLW